MGALADAAMEGGGQVIGIIPQFLLDMEVGHRGIHRTDRGGIDARAKADDGRAMARE